MNVSLQLGLPLRWPTIPYLQPQQRQPENRIVNSSDVPGVEYRKLQDTPKVRYLTLLIVLRACALDNDYSTHVILIRHVQT